MVSTGATGRCGGGSNSSLASFTVKSGASVVGAAGGNGLGGANWARARLSDWLVCRIRSKSACASAELMNCCMGMREPF